MKNGLTQQTNSLKKLLNIGIYPTFLKFCPISPLLPISPLTHFLSCCLTIALQTKFKYDLIPFKNIISGIQFNNKKYNKYIQVHTSKTST